MKFAGDGMGEPRRTFTVYCLAGLCNRLKILLSGLAIAEATAREFSMEWRLTSACACVFSGLFENDHNLSDTRLEPHGRGFDLSVAPWDTLPDFPSITDPDIWARFHDWLVRPTRYPHQIPLEARCVQLLNELMPVPDIAERIAAFRQASFRDTMIGVHLRRGDYVASRPDLAANLKPTLQVVDRWLQELPNAGILLCTDEGAEMPQTGRPTRSEGIVAQFAQRYGSRVVRPVPRSLDRRRAVSIQDAVADLWLLRTTDRFIGTAGSSFSELATFGRKMPAVLAAGPTPNYARENLWLKRAGLGKLVSRLATKEFGQDAPYTLLRWRYKKRFSQWRKHILARTKRT